jgi:hypothetical protein
VDIGLIVTTIVAVILAFSGYLFTYFNNLRLSQRAEKLERVNKQLGEFYGPLFALAHTSKTAWDAFRKNHRPGMDFWDRKDPVSDEDRQAWQLWIKTVFLPVTSRMYELVVTKSDLLIEPEMPPCLIQLCAHVTGYQPTIRKWEEVENSWLKFEERKWYTSYVSYPADTILEYSRDSFQFLKAEQERLLGKKVEQR